MITTDPERRPKAIRRREPAPDAAPFDVGNELRRLLVLADRATSGGATGHDAVMGALAGVYVEAKGTLADGAEDALRDLARALSARMAADGHPGRCRFAVEIGADGARVVDLDGE